MLSAKQWLIMISIGIFFLTIMISAGADHPKQPAPKSFSEREFLNLYKSAVIKQNQVLKNLEFRVECRKRYRYFPDESRSRDYRFSSHLLGKGNSIIVIENYTAETLFGGTERDLVSCTTPAYSFNLSRTDSDKPFLLNLVTHDSSQIENRRPTDELDMFLSGGNLIFFDPLHMSIEAPPFRIVQAKRIPANEKSVSELLSLDLAMHDDNAPFKTGRVLFSPDLNWAVLEYEYRSAPKDGTFTIYSGRNTFTPLQKNGVPMLIQGEHNVVQKTGNQKQFDYTFSARLTSFSFDTVEDAHFRLSHYGLSDVPLAKPTSTTGKQIIAPRCELKDIPANETARQRVTIQNTSSLPLQLLGAAVPCTPSGCASAEGLPLRIPAGQQGSFTILFKATTPGKFDTEIELYTDQPGQTKIKMPLYGTVKENAKVQQKK
ncbi:MAG: DUF1573 domain-containing protein [Gimesia chilikensis]|uniref:DUF1573 domain-containing protein n=1 Tax=Gimesia chilikensis TaxID=2605989 RepID=UPI0037987B01